MSPVASASIDHLETTWRSIDELCSTLTGDEWRRPTGCPGWTVQDVISHLIDYEATALGRPRPEHIAADVSHTKNELGASNEVGVDHRRAWVGPAVLEEFREVTSVRLAQLQDLTSADLAREITTPAGPGTLADMLTLRVMDTWLHEQDVRRAVGRPGHEAGPVAGEAVAYLTRFLPLIVGKRAAAPDGSTVVIEIVGLHRSVIQVANGRASAADDEPDVATVTLSMSPTTFVATVGGRSDAPRDTVITGDVELGRRIVEHLGFLP